MVINQKMLGASSIISFEKTMSLMKPKPLDQSIQEAQKVLKGLKPLIGGLAWVLRSNAKNIVIVRNDLPCFEVDSQYRLPKVGVLGGGIRQINRHKQIVGKYTQVFGFE
jgi:hypothetical protein